MIVFPSREDQVTTGTSGEPHVTPLNNCPKCDRPIGGLSVNNGFTTPVDKGKLQQWVCIHILWVAFRVLTIFQCTPCDLVVFYTAAYATTNAKMLLHRIEERNTARRFKLPQPQQDEFLPRPVVVPVSQTSRGCAKENCQRPRNKGCTFSLCKQCCHARPILDKSCIMHRRDANTLQTQVTAVVASQPTPTPVHPTPQDTQVTSPPLAHKDRTSGAVLDPCNLIPPTPPPGITQPARHQISTQRPAAPRLQERVAAPRSDFVSSGAEISRRRAEGLQMSRNQCSIYLWLEVCLVP